MTPAELIKKYIELRDYVEAQIRTDEERLKPYKDGMDAISGMVQQHLISDGADNIKTEFGTAYRTTHMSVRLADRGALLAMLQDEALHHDDPVTIAETAVQSVASYFTAAVNKEKIKEYLDAKGNAPPGIDITTIQKVNFRRS